MNDDTIFHWSLNSQLIVLCSFAVGSLSAYQYYSVKCYYFSDPNVTVYEIRSDGILTTNCSVTLEASSFSVCFDGSGGMCLHRKFLKFECFEIESDSIFSGT